MGDLEGIIEIDTTYFDESYKGNPVKSRFVRPRPARKRKKQVTKRRIRIGSEQVYVITVTNSIPKLCHNKDVIIQSGRMICTPTSIHLLSF